MVAPFLRPDGDLSPEEQRAAISALAGPLRVPFGRRRAITISVKGSADPVVSNRTQEGILFVEFRSIPGEPAISFLVGGQEVLSELTHPNYVFDDESPLRFLVYPSETLYVRGIAGAAANILFTQVRV